MKMQRLRNRLAKLLVRRNPYFDDSKTGILPVIVDVPEGLSLEEYMDRYTNPLKRILSSVGLSTVVECESTWEDYLNGFQSSSVVMVVHLDFRHLLLAALPGGYCLAQAAAVWYLRTTLHTLGAPVSTAFTFGESRANKAHVLAQWATV